VSGVRLRVGTAATVAVRGELRFRDEEPRRVSGRALRRSGAPEAAPIAVFTHRAGRFTSPGRLADRSELELYAAPSLRIGFTVPEDAYGIRNLDGIAFDCAARR
jgi:hypothetical protein